MGEMLKHLHIKSIFWLCCNAEVFGISVWRKPEQQNLTPVHYIAPFSKETNKEKMKKKKLFEEISHR